MTQYVIRKQRGGRAVGHIDTEPSYSFAYRGDDDRIRCALEAVPTAESYEVIDAPYEEDENGDPIVTHLERRTIAPLHVRIQWLAGDLLAFGAELDPDPGKENETDSDGSDDYDGDESDEPDETTDSDDELHHDA